MKRLIATLIFVFSASLHAANYWVASGLSSPVGSDSNLGTIVAPWLTLARAFNLSGSPAIACGDTINIVADGNYVNGDATIPGLNCSVKIVVRSSLFSLFAPDGYRTNPVADSPNYGNLLLTTGIHWVPESHGSNIGEYGACGIASINSSSVITLGTCTQLLNLINGSQLEIEIITVNAYNDQYLVYAPPIGLTTLQHYYVVNCGSSPACGTTGSTLQLAVTSGGAPITIGSCLIANGCLMTSTDGNNNHPISLSEPLQFTAGSSTITSPDAFGSAIVNQTPVALSAAGAQLFGTLPPEFHLDTPYYVQNISGRTFQLSTDLAGSNIITPSTVGVGPSILANINAPRGFAFQGLKFYTPTFQGEQLGFGGTNETSTIGMISNIEVGHCYFTDDPTATSGVVHSIVDAGKNIWIHDNYISGARTGESQAYFYAGSPGPTVVDNNFLEAATEVVLGGGQGNNSGVPNANKLFRGNEIYKPPTWKIDASAGAPTVGVDPCIYDTTDPLRSGGEWHTDTNTGLKYRCQANGTWGTTLLTVPTPYTIKNSAEFKSGKNITYIGNLHNYSWANNQSGQCYLFGQNNDSGAGAANSNNAAMNNKCLNVYWFMNIYSSCLITSAFPCLTPTGSNNYPGGHVIRNNIAFQNVLMCGVSIGGVQTNCGSSMTQLSYGATGITQAGLVYEHNTIVGPDSATLHAGYGFGMFANASPNITVLGDSVSYNNNLGSYDLQGDTYNGGAMLSHYFTNFHATNNAMVGSNGGVSYASPGATNSFCVTSACFDRPANNAAVGYTNLAGNDFHLTSSSPYSAANGSATVISTDGTDLGADVDLVNMATSGAATGTPPWDVQSNLTISAGSTKAVARLNSPGGGACTWTLYSAPARIVADVVVSVADSAGAAIRNGTWAEIPVTGLTASTLYPYKMDCSGGVVMVGSFSTRAAGSGSYPFIFDWSSATAMLYSSSSSMSSPTSLGAATRQTVPVGTNSIIYAQAVGGPISILVAP